MLEPLELAHKSQNVCKLFLHNERYVLDNTQGSEDYPCKESELLCRCSKLDNYIFGYDSFRVNEMNLVAI